MKPEQNVPVSFDGWIIPDRGVELAPVQLQAISDTVNHQLKQEPPEIWLSVFEDKDMEVCFDLGRFGANDESLIFSVDFVQLVKDEYDKADQDWKQRMRKHLERALEAIRE